MQTDSQVTSFPNTLAVCLAKMQTSGLPNESMLNLIYRLSNKSIELKQPDPPIITEKGVTVIDWNRSESDAVNRYLNRLIRLQINRFCVLKDQEKKKDTDRANRSLNRSRLGIAEDELNDEPLVSVFDSFGKFTDSVELIRSSGRKSGEPSRSKRNHIAYVERLVEPDNLLFYLTLRNYFGGQFSQIKNRLLVIVYINDVYFEKFLTLLAERKPDLHLVIVTYTFNDQGLRHVLRRHFNKFPSLGYLKINNSAGSANTVEIKSYDKTQYKLIEHLVDL